MDWETVSFVISSEARFKTLVRLNGGEETPTQLATHLGVPISHISKALRELAEKNLIELLTPNRKKARFYGITETGKLVLSEIHKITGRRG